MSVNGARIHRRVRLRTGVVFVFADFDGLLAI